MSPQRIVHYREAWYLDCVGQVQRRAAQLLDRIRRATAVDERALDVAEGRARRAPRDGVRDFCREGGQVAVLRFTPERARWVADEQWHPQQEGTWLRDGSYELRIPYREARELVMDVMRYGADVEVVAPVDLRREIEDRLRLATQRYGSSRSV